VVEAYRIVMQLRHQPAAVVLSRQPLPTLDRSRYAPAAGVAHGAYVLADSPGGNPEVIIIASGSEVSVAVEAHEKLLGEGIRSRVVSMPSWEIFDHETPEYRESVSPGARESARRSRAGLDLRVGTIRWFFRPDHWHEDIRSFGAAQRIAAQVRIRTRPRDHCRQAATGTSLRKRNA